MYNTTTKMTSCTEAIASESGVQYWSPWYPTLYCHIPKYYLIIIKGNYFFVVDLRFHWLCFISLVICLWEIAINSECSCGGTTILSITKMSPLLPLVWVGYSLPCGGEWEDVIAPNMWIITVYLYLQMDQLSLRKTEPQGPELWMTYIFP